MWYLGASGDLDHTGRAIWNHYMFILYKQVPIHFSFIGKCRNTVLL